MSHNLQLKVVGDGVEAEEQLEFLRCHGCEEAQGFLIAEPMPAEELPAFLAAGGYKTSSPSP